MPEASPVDNSNDSLELSLPKKSRATLVSTQSTAEHLDHEEPKSLGDKNTMRVESIADVHSSSQVRNSISESSLPVALPPSRQFVFMKQNTARK